uniref:Uncharacterized protein n=1 Tax=Ditylenchus dipsaci TaxID=166011 RepID=A0A915EJW7_9BILA
MGTFIFPIVNRVFLFKERETVWRVVAECGVWLQSVAIIVNRVWRVAAACGVWLWLQSVAIIVNRVWRVAAACGDAL